jgi:hypothetical protein
MPAKRIASLAILSAVGFLLTAPEGNAAEYAFTLTNPLILDEPESAGERRTSA